MINTLSVHSTASRTPLSRSASDAVLLKLFSAVESAPSFSWRGPNGSNPAAFLSVPETPAFRLALPFIDVHPMGIGQYGEDMLLAFHQFRTYDEDILMPPDYSLGRLTMRVIDPFATGLPSLKFDEIHPSRGFRHIKPRPSNPFKEWNYRSIKAIMDIAAGMGITEFFASTKDTIVDRYKRSKLMENNLLDNYVRPFRKEWKLVIIPATGKEETAWHYQQR